MAKLDRVERCYHCGITLQTENESKPGYISPRILEKFPEGLHLCNNCYENERFNTAPRELNFEDNFSIIFDKINKSKAFVVYVVNLFSFEGSFISKLNKKLEGLDVLAVGNKLDLLPEDSNETQLIEYVAHRLRVANLNVLDVVLTSSNTIYNIDLMYQKIVNLSKGRDVYFIGASESGKSSLITELLKYYQNNTRHMIVTHTFENTNLRGFKIPLTNTSYIYEIPGTSIENSILTKVERSVQNDITPRKAIYKRSYNLPKGSTLLFGGLGCVELLSDNKTNISIYMSNKIELKVKKGDSQKLLSTTIQKKNLKPFSDKLEKIIDFDAFDIEVTENGSRDIGILGLGWLSFEGNNQKFRVYVPKGVYVFTTRSKLNNDKK